MGWNKNTVNQSRINSIVDTLIKLNITYTLKEMGSVFGHGLNDNDSEPHSIRRLEYSDYVVLEQMYRTNDCDTDNVISSHEFKKDKEPKNWKLEEREPFDVDDVQDSYDYPKVLNEPDDEQSLSGEPIRYLSDVSSVDKTPPTNTLYNLDENDPEFYEP